MCGIAALFDPQGGIHSGWIAAMADTIRHRGPDDEGYLLADGTTARPAAGGDTPPECVAALGLPPLPAAGEWRVALGHRRLSILDLSPAGHQPMAAGDSWIVFNGEVYNFAELRAELERLGHAFRSHSDTEVILAAWRQWGPECLHRFNGMFALVIYDAARDTVFAARDRFGVKPLYLWRAPNGMLAMASEIKQFTVLPGWSARLAADRAYDFLNWGLTDHTSETLFAGVTQLAGGEMLEWRLGNGEPAIRRWYRLAPARHGLGFDAAARHFAELFEDAVRLRLRADVAVGTGLSGGLDSSSIVCQSARLLAAVGGGRQKTFSACAEDPRFDERRFIAEVVGRTNVDAHQCFPSLDRLFELLPLVTWHQDEPFGSTSIYAEWNVFDLVRSTGTKVTLDGHGADELLGGYHVFFGALLSGLLRGGRLTPAVAEMRALRRNHGYGPAAMAKLVLDALLPEAGRDLLRQLGGKTTRNANWIAPTVVGPAPQDPFSARGGRGRSVDELSVSQLTATSLPLQLHWCDRDSMAHSVESRAPFLDYRLVEFVLGCAPDHRVGDGTTKRLLRTGLADILPPAIAGRRDKMGFVTPEQDWVQARDPAGFRAQVAAAVERSRGVLTPAALDKAEAIIAGTRPYNPVIWRMISFGAWMERFGVQP